MISDETIFLQVGNVMIQTITHLRDNYKDLVRMMQMNEVHKDKANECVKALMSAMSNLRTVVVPMINSSEFKRYGMELDDIIAHIEELKIQIMQEYDISVEPSEYKIWTD